MRKGKEEGGHLMSVHDSVTRLFSSCTFSNGGERTER